MQALIDVILPVFFVIGFGYFAAWRGYLHEMHIDGIMKYATNFAVPVLLFRAISQLDLTADFDGVLLGSFYTGAVIAFAAGMLGARFLFQRDWEDAVAIGFICLFSNSLLLGLAITERAYGPEALTGNYAIVAFHAPFCYGLGITLMEIVRARGQSPLRIVPTVLKAMFRNALILGISLGFIVNLTHLPIPVTFSVSVDMITRSALPVALFAMGGILFRYRPEGDMRTILYCCAVSLILHPAIVWSLGSLQGLDRDGFRSAVLTSTMAPGVNAYLFASMYGRAQRVAASTVLIATAMSILTIWLWLFALP